MYLNYIQNCSFYNKTNKMHQCIKFILFWNDTLHVSDRISVHHQEFKTVHTVTKQILLVTYSFLGNSPASEI